jgi:hypothetical protein
MAALFWIMTAAHWLAVRHSLTHQAMEIWLQQTIPLGQSAVSVQFSLELSGYAGKGLRGVVHTGGVLKVFSSGFEHAVVASIVQRLGLPPQ